ncbi:MAG: major facilitator superfamily 1 [Tardiphaga sp.]|nr:major facilitator superfamily 1 [Tardiphaga sp.]
MPVSTEIPIVSAAESRRFAVRLALFYGAVFGVVGTHLPFFPVWLKAIGIDPSWIGIIIAVPSITRFTTLPFITAAAERRRGLRAALILTAFATTLGFAVLGLLREPFNGPCAVLVVYAITAILWTPTVPLTDGYALKAVTRYGLDYGPLRLWGSAAFVVGALGCGLMIQTIAARHVIWVIAAMAACGAVASLALQPTPASPPRDLADRPAPTLLRDPGFLAIIIASALTQGSHAAYYTFASIAWQNDGIGGLTIAMLWVLGVLAEIVLFALSPRLRWPPATLVIVAALCAVARWIVIAQSPPLALLALVQLSHGITFGLTLVATMSLLQRHVPGEFIARAQGYLAAATGIVMAGTAVVSGPIYAQIGQGLYYLMAAMALVAAVVMAMGRNRVAT